MARATTCMYESKEISIEEALEFRNQTKERKKLQFSCVECGHRVRPHKAGGNASAHFEHLIRNPKCNLSDPAR